MHGECGEDLCKRRVWRAVPYFSVGAQMPPPRDPTPAYPPLPTASPTLLVEPFQQ